MNDESPKTPGDVLLIFQRAITRRNRNPTRSRAIARNAFDATNPSRCAFAFDDVLNALRFEVGALEAPGAPPDGVALSQRQYEDRLWARLEQLVEGAGRSRGLRRAA